MKRTEFYLNTIGGKNNLDYPKVSGWMEEIEDDNGNRITVGYHKVGQNCWSATEITSGMKCIAINTKTKTECIDWVHKNINIITKILRKNMNGDYREKYIQPFINYVSVQ